MSANRAVKISIIGSIGTGKTQLLKRFADGSYEENYFATTKLNRAIKIIKVSDGTTAKVHILDIGRKYLQEYLPYSQASDAFVIVFDFYQRASFLAVKDYLQQIREYAEQQNIKPKVYLVGNKSDYKHQQQVSTQEAEELAKSENMQGFFDVSAKDTQNTLFIRNMFQSIAKAILIQSNKNSVERCSSSIKPSFLKHLVNQIKEDKQILLATGLTLLALGIGFAAYTILAAVAPPLFLLAVPILIGFTAYSLYKATTTYQSECTLWDEFQLETESASKEKTSQHGILQRLGLYNPVTSKEESKDALPAKSEPSIATASVSKPAAKANSTIQPKKR